MERAIFGVLGAAHVEVLPVSIAVLNFDLRVEGTRGASTPIDLNVSTIDVDGTITSNRGHTHVHGKRLRIGESAAIGGSQLEHIGASIL